MGARRIATATCLAALVLAYTAYLCWHGVRATEPHPLGIAFCGALPLVILGLAIALWPRRVARVVAPLLLMVGSLFLLGLAGGVGKRKVLAYCDGLLAAAMDNAAYASEFRALAALPDAHCRIIDFGWGGIWEMAVFSGEERAANFEVWTRDGVHFEHGPVLMRLAGR